MSRLFSPTLKSLQDRLSSNDKGSITAVQTIYVPADDLTDPAVQMIQHELDSIIVLKSCRGRAPPRPRNSQASSPRSRRPAPPRFRTPRPSACPLPARSADGVKGAGR